MVVMWIKKPEEETLRLRLSSSSSSLRGWSWPILLTFITRETFFG
jgi:hypothetical protein